MSRSILWLALVAATANAQPRAPKAKPEEYPVHASADKLGLAAEYMVSSVAGPNGMFVVPDHLVVEIAVYPALGQRPAISAGSFTLRWNGKKTAIMAQSPGFVAAAFKYSDWTQRPQLTGDVGVGDTDIAINRPRPVERFPGDPRDRQTRLPRPPRAPDPEDRSGLDKSRAKRPEEVVVEAALPEGEVQGPVAGYLYFPFKGKTKSIRSLELLYDGPGGPVKLRLM